MAYDDTHTIHDCDKCGKKVGRANLQRLTFLYKDLNDKVHADESGGYRQYFVCVECSARHDAMGAVRYAQEHNPENEKGWMGFPMKYLDENDFYES